LLEQIDYVFEELDVAALIAADRDALNIFLKGRADNFRRRTVVAQMNHFRAAGLQNTPHDVDRSIMAIEERSRGYEPGAVPQGVGRLFRRSVEFGGIWNRAGVIAVGCFFLHLAYLLSNGLSEVYRESGGFGLALAPLGQARKARFVSRHQGELAGPACSP
jgi:hypothetical protein